MNYIGETKQNGGSHAGLHSEWKQHIEKETGNVQAKIKIKI